MCVRACVCVERDEGESAGCVFAHRQAWSQKEIAPFQHVQRMEPFAKEYSTMAGSAPLVTARAIPVSVTPDGRGLNDRGLNLNLARASQFLAKKRWPPGLIKCVQDNLHKCAYRIFIVDDSGSMAASDGNRLVTSANGLHAKKIQCTRWSELAETVKFHGELAYMSQAPTEFRFLNTGHPIQVGTTEDGGTSLSVLQGMLSESPGGVTPLCRHVREVTHIVQSMEQQLRANRQEVSLTIFTDGESSDGNLAAALKPLEGLPVRVVIRLCTDNDNVLNYWNEIDSNLELQMDILDDLFGEYDEVRGNNSWLNYAEPLHRVREWGSHYKEFDLLDEGKLCDDHIRTVCALILGGDINRYPDLSTDAYAFADFVKRILTNVANVMNPCKKDLRPWVNVDKLRTIHDDGCVLM